MRFSGLGCLAAGAVVALSTVAARGTIVASEPFNYSGSTLNGQGSGTGMTGTWADNASPPNNGTNPGGFASGISGATALSNDSTSLTFPGISSSGARISDSDGGYSTRTLSSGLNAVVDATYYVSALFRGSGVLQFDNANFSVWAVGIKNGQFVSAMRDAYSTASATYNGGLGTYDANTTYLMVAKLTAVASGNDTLQVNIYDPTMTVPGTEPGTFDRTSSTNSGQSGSRMALVSFAGSTNEIDEVRIGQSWADVVPEPASMSLLGAATAGLLFRRRRKIALA